MSLRFQMGIDDGSIYGSTLAQTPREVFTKKKDKGDEKDAQVHQKPVRRDQ